MDIIPASAQDASPFGVPPKPGSERHVQSIFSEVLATAGRQGYASATNVDDDRPLDESLVASWDSWFNGQRAGRYAEADDPAELRQGFGEILSRAHSEGGYVDPLGFLSELTSEELQVVQNVHWLADPIDVGSLSEEGALNLLLPPVAQVDLNGDGLTQSGKAWGLHFPDSTTPPDVVAAWDETTAGMDLGEKMIFQLQMKLDVLLANVHLDSQGRFVGITEPGDPAFRNPTTEPGYSYADRARRQLEYLEDFKQQIDPERYESGKDFWTRFHAALTD